MIINKKISLIIINLFKKGSTKGDCNIRIVSKIIYIKPMPKT